MRAGGTIAFLENRTTFLCEHEIFVFRRVTEYGCKRGGALFVAIFCPESPHRTRARGIPEETTRKRRPPGSRKRRREKRRFWFLVIVVH